MSFGCSSGDGGAGVRTNARFLKERMQQKSGKKREKRTRDETKRDEMRATAGRKNRSVEVAFSACPGLRQQ
jgi:hypothetical protein